MGHYAMGGETPELIEQHPQPKVRPQDKRLMTTAWLLLLVTMGSLIVTMA